MMADRFISREWLESLLNSYKRPNCWNKDIMDGDTVLRVIEVLENEIKRAPDISKRQLGNRLLKAKDAALESHLHMIDREIKDSRAEYRMQESKGNATLMGFYKGMLVAREEVRGWLERMLNDGKAPD